LIGVAGAIGLAIALTSPLLLADARESDDSPTQPRLVVFELFNRSESGG
jgi:hypothetical protein